MFTVAVAHGIDTHWRTPGNDSARNTDPSERGTRPDDVHKEDDQLSSREQGDRPSASDDGSDAGKSSPYRTMPSTSHTQKRPPPSQHFWATPGPIRIGGNRFGRAFPSRSLFCSERTEEVPLRDGRVSGNVHHIGQSQARLSPKCGRKVGLVLPTHNANQHNVASVLYLCPPPGYRDAPPPDSDSDDDAQVNFAVP